MANFPKNSEDKIMRNPSKSWAQFWRKKNKSPRVPNYPKISNKVGGHCSRTNVFTFRVLAEALKVRKPNYRSTFKVAD